MNPIRLLILTIILLSLNACLIQKKDPYAYLTKYNLCNKTKTVKKATCPYVNDEKLRIATKRHFSGDSLMIEMRVVVPELTEEANAGSLQANQLKSGECMDYYLELTETEQLRMENIEDLFIVVTLEKTKQCFQRVGERQLVLCK